MNETQTIERGDWAAFAEDFSKQHAGENATLEMVGSDVGDQYAAENLPFVGMTLEAKGSEAGSLTLMLGTEGTNHLERLVAGLQSLELHVTPDGGTVLQIKAADETTMLLHLAPLTALPAP
jgi:hypothetical protein